MSYMYGLLSTIGWVWTGAVFIVLTLRWQEKRDERARGFTANLEMQNKHQHK